MLLFGYWLAAQNIKIRLGNQRLGSWNWMDKLDKKP